MLNSAVATNPAKRRRLRSIVRWFAKLRADRAGGATVFIALSMPAIVGFAAIGTEAGNWYLTKRTLQGAADAAASTAAAARASGTSSRSILVSEAKSIAASYNFVNGTNSTTVTVNYPPSSGTYKDSTD